MKQAQRAVAELVRKQDILVYATMDKVCPPEGMLSGQNQSSSWQLQDLWHHLKIECYIAFPSVDKVQALRHGGCLHLLR